MRPSRNHLSQLVGLGALLVVAVAPATVGTAQPAAATTTCNGGDIVVSSAADSGAGSLRAALATADSSGTNVTVCIDPSTVTTPILISSVLGYTGAHELDIDGNGATVRSNGSSGILDVSSGADLVVNDLTLTGGHASSGAGIYSGEGGLVTVVRSTIEDNVATEDGGGISASDTVVMDSTIADNQAGEGGGGGFSTGTLQAVNSTITGNSDGVDVGGGASVYSSISLLYTTVTDNTGTQGANLQLNSDAGVLTSYASVVADPHGSANCHQASTTSEGYNYSDDASCGFTDTAQGDRQSAGSPMLGTLADNGGPTETLLPATGSPLIDAIPTNACPPPDVASAVTARLVNTAWQADQRGVTRPQQGGCDIGSVEVEPAAPTTTTTAATSSTAAPATPVTVAPTFTG